MFLEKGKVLPSYAIDLSILQVEGHGHDRTCPLL